MKPGMWVGPILLAGILLVELVSIHLRNGIKPVDPRIVSPKEVSLSLFGPYIVGVELASTLLLAGLVGAFYLGRRTEDMNRDLT